MDHFYLGENYLFTVIYFSWATILIFRYIYVEVHLFVPIAAEWLASGTDDDDMFVNFRLSIKHKLWELCYNNSL